MNWSNVFENALGNAISDLIIGIFIAIFVTKFLQKMTEIRESIGMLVLIEAEIQLNRKILQDMKEEMIPAFEQEMKRDKPDELPMDEKTFLDAAEFFKIPAEGLLQDAFQSHYSALGGLENTPLLEKILNFYTVGLHYRIKTSFRMGQLNWLLVDSIKSRLKTEIDNSTKIIREMHKELKILRNKNIYKETIKEIYQIITSGNLS